MNWRTTLSVAVGVAACGTILLVVLLLAAPLIVSRFQVNPEPPNLQSAPTATTALATQVISAAKGGRVTLADGSQVEVPAGALSSDTPVSLSVLATVPNSVIVPQQQSARLFEVKAGDGGVSRAELFGGVCPEDLEPCRSKQIGRLRPNH